MARAASLGTARDVAEQNGIAYESLPSWLKKREAQAHWSIVREQLSRCSVVRVQSTRGADQGFHSEPNEHLESNHASINNRLSAGIAMNGEVDARLRNGVGATTSFGVSSPQRRRVSLSKFFDRLDTRQPSALQRLLQRAACLLESEPVQETRRVLDMELAYQRAQTRVLAGEQARVVVEVPKLIESEELPERAAKPPQMDVLEEVTMLEADPGTGEMAQRLSQRTKRKMSYEGEKVMMGALSKQNTKLRKVVTFVDLVAATRMRLWLLMSDSSSSGAANAISILILLLIVVTVVTFCLETMDTFSEEAFKIFNQVEVLCVSIFSAEYLLKFISAPKVWEFFRAPLNLIDLIAVLPFFVEQFAKQGGSLNSTRVLRIVRLVRVFRVLKLGTHYGRIQVVWLTMVDSLDVLCMMGFLIMLSVVVFSSFIFFAERGEWNDDVGGYVRAGDVDVFNEGRESPFKSIPASFWWCIVTLMTVGYGDQYPVTTLGKIVAAGAMIASIFILVLPITVIGTNFNHQWAVFKQAYKFKSGRPLAASFTKLSKSVGNHISVLEDTIRRCAAVEVEIQEQLARIQETIATTKAKLATELPPVSRKPQLAACFLGFIGQPEAAARVNSDGDADPMVAKPLEDGGDLPENARGPSLVELLKARMRNKDAAPASHDLDLSDASASQRSINSPKSDRGRSARLPPCLVIESEADPVADMINILELEGDILKSCEKLENCIEHSQILMSENFPALLLQTRMNYQSMSRVYAESTVVMEDLAKVKASYKAKLSAATAGRARRLSQIAPEAITAAQRTVAEQVAKLANTSKMISTSKAEPETPNKKIEKLCELLQQREELQWERQDKTDKARERDVADKVELFAKHL